MIYFQYEQRGAGASKNYATQRALSLRLQSQLLDAAARLLQREEVRGRDDVAAGCRS